MLMSMEMSEAHFLLHKISPAHEFDEGGEYVYQWRTFKTQVKMHCYGYPRHFNFKADSNVLKEVYQNPNMVSYIRVL